jgi:hypothetical protein
MKIYIGNLSAEITSPDLAPYFRGYGNYPSFKFKYYQKNHKRFYYALTSTVPESLGRKAIAGHYLKRIKGRMIALHAYKDRALSNERRSLDWRSKLWAPEECRKSDRRHLQYDKHSNDAVKHVEQAHDHARA